MPNLPSLLMPRRRRLPGAGPARARTGPARIGPARIGPARIGPARIGAARIGAAGLVLVLGAALGGCGHAARSGRPAIELDTAYVAIPRQGATDAYLVIRDNGAADRLISARSSAGGTVTFSGPVSGNPAVMRTVTSIAVPGHALIRLVPNSYHLVIAGSGPMKGGTEITLTLRFARAGTFQVPAQVTNPQTGGASYFLN